jgi:hypothetical protein
VRQQQELVGLKGEHFDYDPIALVKRKNAVADRRLAFWLEFP